MLADVHTAELLVPELSSHVEIATEKLERCKSPGAKQIHTELIKQELMF
jgi:hypothetical protein